MNWRERLKEKIKKYLDGYSACHDFWHAERVYKNAQQISEKVRCDNDILEASALLHDVGYKNHEDDTREHWKYSVEIAKKWLPECGFPADKISDTLEVIRQHDNFNLWKDKSTEHKDEVKVLQDADRIDALGAIGIARIAYFFGEFRLPLHNPNKVPNDDDVWLNHSFPDQVKRENQIWERLNYPYSKEIAKEKHEFGEMFYNKIASELSYYHGGYYEIT